VTVLRPQRSGIPLPVVSELSRPYWDGCAEGKLTYQACQVCGTSMSDPGYLCRWCHSPKLEWRTSSGRGTIYSWSVVWRPQTADFEVPYVVIIVELAEKFSIVSNLIGCEPADARAGLPVLVEFHEVGGMMLPYFAPAPPGAEPAAG
jgi:uncharacterized OB-fold protein